MNQTTCPLVRYPVTSYYTLDVDSQVHEDILENHRGSTLTIVCIPSILVILV